MVTSRRLRRSTHFCYAASGSERETQSIVRNLDIRRQRSAHRFVLDVVRNVRQVRSLRPQLLDDGERLLQTEVRRMRTKTQGIQNQHLETFEPPHALFRDFAYIR